MANKNIPSLDGLIQTKGAPRPDALSQRGESPARDLQESLQASIATPAPAIQTAVQAIAQPRVQAAPAGREPRAKSLTLRLSETQYERLRRFAFDARLSHQDIIEAALMAHFDQQERSK
jgi:hypothetical protein